MDLSAFLDGFAVVTQPEQPALLPDRRASSACSSACCPASARPPRWRSCCRSSTPSTRSRPIIMLAGIYYGAQYGGTITSVLLRIPGEAIVGGHRVRRLRAGQAGQGRHRARHRRDRLVHRRDRLDHRPDAARRPLVAESGRSTSARRSTPRWRCSACCWSPPSAAATPSRPSIAAASACSWPPSARDSFTSADRFTFGSLQPRRRHRLRRRRDGPVRRRRDPLQPRGAPRQAARARPPSPTSGPPARTSRRPAPPSAAARSSASSSACCPVAAR